MTYKEGDCVIVQTKHYGPYYGIVGAVDPDGFKDQTGQRRSNSKYATFSTAITQAPHAYLIRALKHSNFFDVVERVSLDAVTKERQLIRSTRETFDEEQKLMPLKFG